MSATHVLLGGKLNVYKRENSRFWQCSAFFNGRNHRASTKEESLAQAKDFAGTGSSNSKAKCVGAKLPAEALPSPKQQINSCVRLLHSPPVFVTLNM